MPHYIGKVIIRGSYTRIIATPHPYVVHDFVLATSNPPHSFIIPPGTNSLDVTIISLLSLDRSKAESTIIHQSFDSLSPQPLTALLLGNHNV